MSFDRLLNKTCSIQRKSESQNATGSVTASWSNAYTGIPVRYNRVSQGKGRVSAGSYQVTLEDYVFYFKVGQDVTISDRIVVDGKTFEVEHVYKDSSDHHLEVFAKLKSFN